MSNILLSVVTGTYMRLDFLRAALDSVRRQIPTGFDFELIVVDGGSTDGTEAYCLAQADVVFIQQGKLLGAIKAFDAGCEVARGEYLMLINDDALIVDGSIVRALAYLTGHPQCGAVAVMDDRRAPGYEQGGYHVQTINAIRPDGRPMAVPYAQIGVYRTAIAREAGFWGSRDPIMSNGHTYGGDSFLSARIWEMGYTVDAVEGVAANDRVADDGLRTRNGQIEQQIGSAFYRRFPNGVQLPATKSVPYPEVLRILYLPLFSPGYGRYKRGLYDALSKVGVVYELDYVKHRSRFTRAVQEWQPHIILSQFHDGDTIPAHVVETARKHAPGAVMVNWCGDVYLDQLTAPNMLELLKHVDLQLVVNDSVIPVYEEHGIKAAYWQIGFEPVPEELPEMPSHDLLFMANAYSPARLELGAVLRKLDPKAGIYGTGWYKPSGNSFYDFAKGAALYRNCKIAIGDNQYMDKGFVSNRFFEALSNGAFLLHQTIPGLEELTGYIDGVHYASWRDFDDLKVKARQYMNDEPARKRIAAAGEQFTREHHSFDARVKQLFEDLLPKAMADGRADERREAVADIA